MLTDEEAEEIGKGLAEGWRDPILLRWIEQPEGLEALAEAVRHTPLSRRSLTASH